MKDVHVVDGFWNILLIFFFSHRNPSDQTIKKSYNILVSIVELGNIIRTDNL